MTIEKMKFATIVGSVVATLTLVTGYVAGQGGVPREPATPIFSPRPEPSKTSAPLRPDALARARLDLARRTYAEVEKLVISPPVGNVNAPTFSFVITDQLALWSVRWMEAECDLDGSKAGRITALEAHLKRLVAWEEFYQDLLVGEAAGVTPQSHATLKFYRLQAEYRLAQETL